MVNTKDFFDGVKLFLFDLDGTLRRIRPTGHDALVTYAQAQDVAFSVDNQREGVHWAHRYWANHDQIKTDRETLEEGAFWKNYIKYYLQAMNTPAEQVEMLADTIGQQFMEDFTPEGYLVSGAKELLWDLREDDYQLGLVSNRREPLTGVAIELGIVEHFHFTLSAGQVGSWKPDTAIFQHALSMAGDVLPQQTVYIGDNYYTDGIGALSAGMKSILIDDHGIYDFVPDECLIIRDIKEIKQYL